MFKRLLIEWEVAYLAKGGSKSLVTDSEDALRDFANWLDAQRILTPHETDTVQTCPACAGKGRTRPKWGPYIICKVCSGAGHV